MKKDVDWAPNNNFGPNRKDRQWLSEPNASLKSLTCQSLKKGKAKQVYLRLYTT